ncbi:MAG: ABC transporter permease [Caldisericia bacterium]|nr:ABC transporter permease [Caldisericia bacterium]
MDKFILKYFNLIRTLIAILIGAFICVLIIFIISKEPQNGLKYFFLGPFSSIGRLGNVIEMASPIILCGLAIAIPFQAEQFNIGAEGALFISAAVATGFGVSTNFPKLIHIPLMLLVAGGVGAFWGFIPGILKAKWKASELVITLMLNYVALYLSLYIINFHFRDKKAGFLVSYQLPKTAWFDQFVKNTRIHYGVILTIIFVILVYVLLYKTKLGYEIRMTGFNINFAKYGGINTFKIILITQVIGGFIAGIAGISEVMGIHRRFNWQTTPGYGWDGVVVAIIGRNHPVLIAFASIFIAYLRVSGQVLNLLTDIPAEIITVLESIIILLITAEAFLTQWKYRITVREAEKREVKIESAS